jgi:RND family efflux transporter MFP subunit
MGTVSALLDLSSAYHTCRDVDSLLKTLAAKLAHQLKARAALVWVAPEGKGEMVCRGQWFETGLRFEPVPVTEGFLVELFTSARARRFAPEEIKPDRLTHLAENDRELVKTALYAPLPGSRGVAAVVELLNKTTGEFTAEDAALAEEAARLTGRALEVLQTAEREHQSGLETIERLTSLYDISRIFNSTLELEELLPVVADKIRDIIGAQACNLWLVDSDAEEIYFAQQVGEDPTTNEDDRLPLGEGLVGSVAQHGEARLVKSAEDEPLLAARQSADKEFTLKTLMCAPLLKDEQVLGVVEVVNKSDATAFNDDDLFFFTSMAEQAAIALHNANLLQAERKVHELDALLAISKEITSTLNLDHILTTVVHQAATVVPFDRCVIGLFDRNRFVLGAVSGETEVPRTREMEELCNLLEWVADQTEAVRADAYEEGWQVTPESIRPRLVPYLEALECHGFYALPLRDDQGVVGVLALQSGDAEFLSENHLEILSILASQSTVAIRNARLYQEVPLMSLWQPLVEKKQKLMAVPYGRWVEMGWKVGLVALVLIVVPWKMRIGTNAAVVPAERRVVSAEVEGVIHRVLVREGESVAAGTVLAQLDDSDARVGLERAAANLAITRRQLAEAEAGRDLGAVGQARLRIEMYEAESAFYREKVEKARLRAPIQGVVVTPKVEEKVGQLLTPGNTFCELVDQERMAVEMNVPESQVDLIQPGAGVSIKLNTYPTHTYRGTVERVSAQTISAEEEQFFVVRAVFPNPKSKVRTGMVGRAKITAAGGWFQSGWYPVGYVVLRSPARWAWRTIWTWLP